MNTKQEILIAGGTTVYSLFNSQAQTKKHGIALEFQQKQWSYFELNNQVKKFASVLSNHGLKAGDRVAILSENRPEYIISELACAMLGLIIACQNWRLSLQELKHCISIVNPRLLLVSAKYSKSLLELNFKDVPVINFDKGFKSLLKLAPKNILKPKIDPESGLVILYTSGTTGLPKGALISHRAQIARMCALRLDTNIRESDAFVAWAPMFHMASTDQTLGALMSGSTVICIDGFKPDQIINAASHYNLGWLVMFPGSIKPMIAYLKEKKPTLKSIACVGAMADLVPRQELADLTKLLSAPYLNSFGSTETGLPPASAALIAPGSKNYSLSKKVSSICEIRLIDKDGNEVKEGKPGELAICGPTVFSGYWNNPKTNQLDFSGGWFRMGDLFCRNKNGTLDFVDRAKYMIKSGGENIYPAEIERVLLADKRISEAVIIKKADAEWGEVPIAFVSRNDISLNVNDIESLCRRNLASYKRPKEVHFITLKEFPRSTTGKILRHEMDTWLN